MTTPRHESGVALISTVLIMMLVSALLVGFTAMIVDNQRSSFTSRDQTSAYAAAHAGLEQLTNNLGELFAVNWRPTGALVTGLAGVPPALPGVTFEGPGGTPGYRILFNDTAPADGFPDMEPTPRVITSGPYQGLQGSVTPYTVEVTARTRTGAEARMRRTMQTVLIPAFQFGVFSENDLSFFAGPDFNFGGRVHTNSNLFVAEGDGNDLVLADRVSAVGEVVRRNLSNGWPTATNYTGRVRIARAPGVFRDLAMNEGSWSAAVPQLPPPPQPGVIPAPGSNEPTWTNVSVTAYNGNLKNARTGARPLVLPLVQMGAQPIDLIRRPAVDSNEDVANPAVFGQRYYARASIRILLSDRAEDITDLPDVTATPPVDLSTLRPGTAPAWYALGMAGGAAPIASAAPHPVRWYRAASDDYRTFGTPLPAETSYYAGSGYWLNAGEPIITGFIKIELQRNDLTWVDITQDVLALGFTGRRLSATNPDTTNPPAGGFQPTSYYVNDTAFNSAGALPCAHPSPDAVIRIQRVKDDHTPSYGCGFQAANVPSQQGHDYWPNVLFDPREGNMRDANATGSTVMPLGGVMHYVELDLGNLVRYINGDIGGADGPTAENSDGGYVVYFSDRRTNQRVGGEETGEYGFEDIINPASVAGVPNGALDAGEDVNGVDRDGDGSNLDTYGGAPLLPAAGTLRGGTPVSAATRPWTTVSAREARSNPPLFFRRALKVVNASRAGSSPLVDLPAGTGLTIVSENPVYLEGNYNTASGGGFGATQDDHRPSAVVADSVTLLSTNWNDIRSFVSPQNPGARAAVTTWYRTAIVSGKGLSFLRPDWAPQDFGTDGGAHNFLRYIESWSGDTLNYRGSIISFFISRQGVGAYKCCTNVYSPPTRGYNFDTEFLNLSLLPPKSPAFRDVNTLTFRRILRPTQ